MRIDQLSATNFKNFSNLNVNFKPGVNLFVGTNGSGKTSILEAINVALGGFFVSQGSRMSRPIQLSEVRIVNRVRQPEVIINATSSEIDQGGWTRTFRTRTKTTDLKGAAPISSIGSVFFDKYFLDSEDRHIAPLIAYYSTQRLFKDSYVSERQKYDAALGRQNGYLLCLRESAIKQVLVDWLSNAVIRRASKYANNIEEIDLILQNVEMAIRDALVFGMDIPEDSKLRIYPDPDFDNEIFIRYDEAHDLPLSYYSDGFRNLIYLIFDIIWRASQLNPWLSLNEISEQVKGVVTIDEIDLHLHPKWQAKAINLLQKLFPQVQFFITTHSPTVVANFENGTLYVISNNEVHRHENDYFGKQVNNILRNILGATDRHVPTQRKLDELFRLIDDNKKEQYEALLASLVNQLGQEDADIQKAFALIAMKEFENDENNAVH